MTDALAPIDLKVRRARALVAKLASLITSKLAPDAYRFEKSLEPGGSRVAYRVRDVPTADLEWSIRIGEVLHQLRSALDHLAWQLVLLDGARPSRQTQFPILDRAPTDWPIYCARSTIPRSCAWSSPASRITEGREGQ